MAKEFTKVYDENARLKAELAILKEEYTCEECEECFVDKETGINAPSICMACWNAMVTKLRAEIDQLKRAIKDQLPTSLSPCPKCERYGVTSKQEMCDKCRIEVLEELICKECGSDACSTKSGCPFEQALKGE